MAWCSGCLSSWKVTCKLTTSGSCRTCVTPMPMPFRLVIGLEKNWKARRRHAMRTGLEALAQGDCDLVIEKAVFRMPKPSISVLGWNLHIGWAWHMFKVLQSPGIGFADRHGGC